MSSCWRSSRNSCIRNAAICGRRAALLGLITAFTQAAVYGGVAVGALRAHRWLAGNRRAGLAAARAVGAVLLGAALLSVLQGWA